AKRLEPLERAVGRDGKVEHLKPARGRESLANRMRAEPLLELIAVSVLVSHAPAHVHRRTEDGNANGPLGFLDPDRIVVHAKRIGEERLAEEASSHHGHELKLEEVAFEVSDDVGVLKPHPSTG